VRGIDTRVSRVQLLEWLDGASLARLACVSRAWYVFVHSTPDLWKNLLLLADLADNFKFMGCWKDTYASAVLHAKAVRAGKAAKDSFPSPLPTPHTPIKVHPASCHALNHVVSRSIQLTVLLHRMPGVKLLLGRPVSSLGMRLHGH